MRVTARDIVLLQNIGRFRLASSRQLARLDGGSAQNVSRALLALFENGYVERPVAQVASRLLHNGSRPAIYGLTRKGARLLGDQGYDVRRSLLDGIDKEFNADAKDSDTFSKLARYETALERSLYKALHEFQRLQAARNGQPVPIPEAVDVDVSVSAQA